MQTKQAKPDNLCSPDSALPRKAYETPALREYGTILRFTSGASGTVGDGQGMNMRPSDERAKTNIRCVGQHPAGFGLYLFDYKPEFREFGIGRQFGVMAQEVEAVVPQAVIVGADGYRRVDYALLGISQAKH